MKRSDRLFEIIQILRDGRLYTASNLADRLEVSLRTIYRDMDTLIASGVPVAGERGVGYMTTAAITLPPLNLTKTELEALHVGMAVVGKMADDDLRHAAESLLAKLDAVMPEDRRAPVKGWGFAATPVADAIEGFRHMPALRNAIRAMQKISVKYDDPKGPIGKHILRPLELEYWGRVWTVLAWDETQSRFYVFRVDKITECRALPGTFVDEIGKTLEDYRASLTDRGNT
ncbi:MAG: helix-turn-helix transcriptional regulator [Planktomarina sp.]